MTATPYNTLTTDELTSLVLVEEGATWRELELVARIHQLQDMVEDLKNALAEAGGS